MLEMLAIVPLLLVPAAAAFMNGKKANYVRYAALAASLISLAIIILVFMNPAGQVQSINWFVFGSYSFSISTSMMPLNLMLLLLVGIITPLVLAYSIGYMDLPSEQQRFYSEICVFAAAMMLFAMSADLITMFIGWELLGLTSYLLIGFWYGREGTADAALKAISTVLIGDILMLAAILLIWSTYHTFSFAAILSSPHTLQMQASLFLIMMAAFTKSAQFPFNEWLADAMKGPTPVSAFLHSSTMVKAGVFVVAVLFPLFVQYKMLYLLLIFGAATAIIGALNALCESNIKRVLAYSTMEDLGLMFFALGAGSITAAIMLFFLQTFYKALLFMYSGYMIKASDHNEEMDRISPLDMRSAMFISGVIGAAALAGIAPFGSFFGKAALAQSLNVPLYLLIIAVEALSAIYIFRWLLLPERKADDRSSKAAKGNYAAVPKSMRLPIYALAAMVAISGFVAYAYLPAYLGPYGVRGIQISAQTVAESVVVGVFGALAAYLLFYRKGYSISSNKALYALMYNTKLTNRFYKAVSSSTMALAAAIERIDVMSYRIVKGGAQNMGALANALRKMENGRETTYVIAFVIGLILVVLLFVV